MAAAAEGMEVDGDDSAAALSSTSVGNDRVKEMFGSGTAEELPPLPGSAGELIGSMTWASKAEPASRRPPKSKKMKMKSKPKVAPPQQEKKSKKKKKGAALAGSCQPSKKKSCLAAAAGPEDPALEEESDNNLSLWELLRQAKQLLRESQKEPRLRQKQAASSAENMQCAIKENAWLHRQMSALFTAIEEASKKSDGSTLPSAVSAMPSAQSMGSRSSGGAPLKPTVTLMSRETWVFNQERPADEAPCLGHMGAALMEEEMSDVTNGRAAEPEGAAKPDSHGSGGMTPAGMPKTSASHKPPLGADGMKLTTEAKSDSKDPVPNDRDSGKPAASAGDLSNVDRSAWQQQALPHVASATEPAEALHVQVKTENPCAALQSLGATRS